MILTYILFILLNVQFRKEFFDFWNALTHGFILLLGRFQNLLVLKRSE